VSGPCGEDLGHDRSAAVTGAQAAVAGARRVRLSLDVLVMAAIVAAGERARIVEASTIFPPDRGGTRHCAASLRAGQEAVG
jgi:hypothetical protein